MQHSRYERTRPERSGPETMTCTFCSAMVKVVRLNKTNRQYTALQVSSLGAQAQGMLIILIQRVHMLCSCDFAQLVFIKGACYKPLDKRTSCAVACQSSQLVLAETGKLPSLQKCQVASKPFCRDYRSRISKPGSSQVVLVPDLLRSPGCFSWSITRSGSVLVLRAARPSDSLTSNSR